MAETHLEVVGRVQGVGFRWFIREYARRSLLSGFVRNLANGHVEIAAAGSDDAIAGLVRAAGAGPPGCHVERVMKVEPQDVTNLPFPFAVIK